MASEPLNCERKALRMGSTTVRALPLELAPFVSSLDWAKLCRGAEGIQPGSHGIVRARRPAKAAAMRVKREQYREGDDDYQRVHGLPSLPDS